MKDISQIFKSEIKIEDVKQENGIFCCMNDHFVSGENQKYYQQKAIPRQGTAQG